MTSRNAPTLDLSRRRLLQAFAVGAGTVAVGSAGAGVLTAGPAAGHGTIITPPDIAGATTYYEVNGQPTAFGYNPDFHARLVAWMGFLRANTPSDWSSPERIYSQGAHTDHRPSEAHNAGRGFDLARVDSASDVLVFNGRYDQWSAADRAGETPTRARYWAVAASAHHAFKHVLTYEYNAGHHNHIHIDNLASGQGDSTFSTGSSAQVQGAQAFCRYVWGTTTGVDGIWGPQTDTHTREVLARIGVGGALTGGQASWLAFCRATTRKGSGLQAY